MRAILLSNKGNLSNKGKANPFPLQLPCPVVLVVLPSSSMRLKTEDRLPTSRRASSSISNIHDSFKTAKVHNRRHRQEFLFMLSPLSKNGMGTHTMKSADSSSLGTVCRICRRGNWECQCSGEDPRLCVLPPKRRAKWTKWRRKGAPATKCFRILSIGSDMCDNQKNQNVHRIPN